jgi:hypothetical protein
MDVPNAETQKAMEDVRAGQNISPVFDTAQALLKDLLAERELTEGSKD